MPPIQVADRRGHPSAPPPRPRITGFPPAPERGGAEHRFLMMRLGLSFGDCETLAAAGRAAMLPPDLRSRLRERLARERLRLARLGRARSLAYDINRHIAVRAAMLWIDDASPA